MLCVFSSQEDARTEERKQTLRKEWHLFLRSHLQDSMPLNFMRTIRHWVILFLVLMFKCSFIEAAVSWSKAQQITGDIGANVVSAQVAIDNNGNIVVVWEEVEGTSGDSNKGSIKGGVLNFDNKGVLSSKEQATVISNVGSSPLLSMNGNGKAVAVWLGGDNTVQTSNRKTSDSVWSEAIPLPITGAVGLQVAVDGEGNTLVIWLDDSNGKTFVKGVSQIGDNQWSDPVFISEQDAYSPQIAVNGGIAAAVWENKGEVTSVTIQGATAEISGNSFAWNPPVTLSEARGISSSPQVAVGSIISSEGDVSEYAVAIWRFFYNDNSYSIQYANSSSSTPYEWVNVAQTIADVSQNGVQYVVAAKDSFAYWSDGKEVQFSESSLQSEELFWSTVGKYTSPTDLGLSLDAIFFEGIMPWVIWSQNQDSIEVGYPIFQIDPLSLQTSTLTSGVFLPTNPSPMIASNNIIVAIWIEKTEDGSDGSTVLMAATGTIPQSFETSKRLMYWGVDDSFQRDFP